MAYQLSKADVWVGKIKDKPGALGSALTALKKAGARLEFLFARPLSPGQAVYFLAPLRGAGQLKIAKSLGLIKYRHMSLRIAGPDKPGLGARITGALGADGINIQGLTAMGAGKSCLFYVAVAKKDLPRAQRVLKKIL